MGKVIYLTGAPASGKTTALRMLCAKRTDLLVWEYGERLADYLNEKSNDVISHEDLRTRSAQLTLPEHIRDVDQKLTEYVAANRAERTVFVNSHPVTKEQYGFRITPFSQEQFRRLAPTEIWVLYASPSETVARIKRDPAGRPNISLEEAAFHTTLQSSIASTYATATGCPVYLFNTEVEPETLLASLERRIA